MMELIAAYGWFILAAAGLCYYFYKKFNKTRIQNSGKIDLRELDSDEAFKKNEAMERARLRMQEKLNEDAEKRRQREAEKRSCQQGGATSDRQIEMQPESCSVPRKKPDKKPRLRGDDFNPLMSTYVPSYRPSRNSGPSAGGG